MMNRSLLKRSSFLRRARECKITYWINSAYLRRSKWDSLKRAVASAVVGPTVYFSPDYPHANYIIRRLCAFGGIEVTTDPALAHDLSFAFADQTFVSSERRRSPTDDSSVNCHCTDISKTNVQRVFEEVFGHSLAVDPATYEGEAIAKSNVNAKHDGQVVSCPGPHSEEGKVYQKRIDNRVKDDLFLDYRTTIVGGSIPVVVCKYWRAEDGKMPGPVTEASAASAADLFTDSEIENILAFSERLGLDYGELDVLRDNKDGRLYIVDANSTPIGPREELSDRDYHDVLSRMLASLRHNLISK